MNKVEVKTLLSPSTLKLKSEPRMFVETFTSMRRERTKYDIMISFVH